MFFNRSEEIKHLVHIFWYIKTIKIGSRHFFLILVILYCYIRTEYRKIRTRKNSIFAHFLRSVMNHISRIQVQWWQSWHQKFWNEIFGNILLLLFRMWKKLTRSRPPYSIDNKLKSIRLWQSWRFIALNVSKGLNCLFQILNIFENIKVCNNNPLQYLYLYVIYLHNILWKIICCIIIELTARKERNNRLKKKRGDTPSEISDLFPKK